MPINLGIIFMPKCMFKYKKNVHICVCLSWHIFTNNSYMRKIILIKIKTFKLWANALMRNVTLYFYDWLCGHWWPLCLYLAFPSFWRAFAESLLLYQTWGVGDNWSIWLLWRISSLSCSKKIQWWHLEEKPREEKRKEKMYLLVGLPPVLNLKVF